MIAPFLDDYVSLDKETHVYRDKDGKVYESVSRFRDRFKKPFDPQIAYKCAGKDEYVGMTGEEVLAKWKAYGTERADEGTEIHDACEFYEKTGLIKPRHEKWTPAIISITSEYKDYYKSYQEQILYDEEYMIAGTADALRVTSSHKDAPIDISDYKTNIKGVHVKDFKKDGKPKHEYFLHCLSHLLLSKYSDYALQLSIYAYMLEKKTGRRIGSLRIHYINPLSPLEHKFIPVPYMKHEAIEMLKWKKQGGLFIPEEEQSILSM